MEKHNKVKVHSKGDKFIPDKLYKVHSVESECIRLIDQQGNLYLVCGEYLYEKVKKDLEND